MICAVCRKRKVTVFGWFNPAYPAGSPRRDENRRWVCSLGCLSEVTPMTEPNNPWLTEVEIERLCTAAGEYIESVGKTDLMKWSKEEFTDLLEVVLEAHYSCAKKESVDELLDDEVPY